MAKRSNATRLAFSGPAAMLVVFLWFASEHAALAQSTFPTAEIGSQRESARVANIDDEELKGILFSQPNFSARMRIVVSPEFEGEDYRGEYHGSIARFGTTFRIQSPNLPAYRESDRYKLKLFECTWIYFRDRGPTAIIPNLRGFARGKAADPNVVAFGYLLPWPYFVAENMKIQSGEFIELPEVSIGKHRCRRVRISNQEDTALVSLAKDLRNLAIRIEFYHPDYGEDPYLVGSLEDVSFTVDAKMMEPPAGYTEIEEHFEVALRPSPTSTPAKGR